MLMKAAAYDQVALWYDAYASTEIDAPFYLQECNTERDRVLELACGTGRVSLPLLRAGVRLTCVDQSPGMLAVLEQKASREDLVVTTYCGDVRSLDLEEKFDLVIMPFTSFEELVDPVDQLATLQTIQRHLSPYGRFLCVLHNRGPRLAAADNRLTLLGRYELPVGQTLLVWKHERPAPDGTVTGFQLFEVYDSNAFLESKLLWDVHFKLFEHDEVISLAVKAGFEVAAVYGDLERRPYIAASSPLMILNLRPA